MNRKVMRLAILAGLGVSASRAALAESPPSAPPAMSDEINSLKTQISELEARQAREELARKAADERIEAQRTSADLAASAARQDHFLTAEGFTAGYSDDRFVLQSSDGNFVFRPWLQLQFREVVLDRKVDQGSKTHTYDKVDDGFEVRQVRFGVDGNLFSPDFTYFFNWATQRASGATPVNGLTSSTGAPVTVSNNLGGVPVLQQAWVKYRLHDTPWLVKLGEMKDPVLHEQIVDTRFQQIAERSITADIFVNGDDFTEAATVGYDAGKSLRVDAGVNHGMRAANTNFAAYPSNPYNYGVVGRAEWKFMGRWKDYNQVGAVGTTEPLLVAGTGADYSERGHEGQVVAAADLMYAEPSGLNVYADFVDRYTTHNFGYYLPTATGASINAGNPAVAGKPTNEYGVVAQTGFLINQHFEPFARYEFIHLQGTPTASHNWVQAVTGGANYYFHGHRVKLTAQGTWLTNGIPIDDSPNDVLANPNGKGEFTFIGQLQFLL